MNSPASAAPGISTPYRNDLKILIVDDHDDLRLIIFRMLKRAGYTQIEEADCGEIAVALARNFLFDVILLDLSMPGIGGFKACHEIRKFHGRTKSRIIACTAHASLCSKEHFLECGFCDVLAKPFSYNQLLQSISIPA